MKYKAIAVEIAIAVLSCVTLASAVASTEKPAGTFTVYRSQPAKAKALLDQAVEYMNANSSERAFAAFNNQGGHFHDKDLYVFVVGLRDGVMHAHGGAPEALVGASVTELKDALGKPVIREMLDVVERDGEGTVDYVWLNRITNRVENKTTTVTRVGDYMLGVGYYTK